LKDVACLYRYSSVNHFLLASSAKAERRGCID
jgi:hypothetical protein